MEEDHFFPDERIVQDLPITDNTSRSRLFCPNRASGDFRTIFWFYVDPVKRTAWNALTRPNVHRRAERCPKAISGHVCCTHRVAYEWPRHCLGWSQPSRRPSTLTGWHLQTVEDRHKFFRSCHSKKIPRVITRIGFAHARI